MDDGIQFMNMDTWRGSGKDFGISFEQIVMQHINRCVINGSVEFHGGYWIEKNSQNNSIERTYIQNSREVFCNSVKMLRALLLGYYDDKITPIDSEIIEQIKILDNEFIDNPKIDELRQDKLKHFYKKIQLYTRLFEELVKLTKSLNFFQEEHAVDYAE